MTRMKYHREGEFLVSPAILVGEQFAYVEINPTTLTFNIRDAHNNIILTSGEADTLAKLKNAAKSTLIVMGSIFYQEIKIQSKLELE